MCDPGEKYSHRGTVPAVILPPRHHLSHGATGVNTNTNATVMPALTPLPNTTVVKPALRAVNGANENNYQGEQLQYDTTSMGFAIGIFILIGAFFAYLLLADCGRGYRVKKLLFWRRPAKSGGSSNNNKNNKNNKEKAAAASPSPFASASASVKPFDAAAQMEAGNASGSEGETTLQADPSRENVGAGPSSSSSPNTLAAPATAPAGRPSSDITEAATAGPSTVTPRNPPRLPSL